MLRNVRRLKKRISGRGCVIIFLENFNVNSILGIDHGPVLALYHIIHSRLTTNIKNFIFS